MPNSRLLSSLGTHHSAVFKQGVGTGWKPTASRSRPSSAQTTFINASFALVKIDQCKFERKNRCQGDQLVAIMSEHVLNMLKQISTLKHATCRQATLQVPAAVPRPNKSALIRRQGRNFPLRSWLSTSKCCHPTSKKYGSLTHLLPTFLSVPCPCDFPF